MQHLASPAPRLHRSVGRIAATIAALFLAVAASAQTQQERLDASPRHQEWVTISYGDGGSVSAFVVYPERAEAADSVVVIHDIRGMGEWIRLVGDRLAEAGYVAVVPDLLTGKGPDGGDSDSFTDGGAVGKAIRELDKDELTARLDACADYARALPSTTDAVSVAGFCWGGAESFRYATNDDTLKAAFVFYGSPPPSDDMARIAAPVYGFYGENDNRINATIEETKVAMAAAGKTYDPVIYEGMGHGFTRKGMSEDASDLEKQRTAEAFARWIELLGKP